MLELSKFAEILIGITVGMGISGIEVVGI